jgi:signal transduction histidine kinase
MLEGQYDSFLVIVSILVAMFASYTALSLAGRVSHSSGRAAGWWLAGGAMAMGTGIWSMHFIGMLSFRLPIPLGYDLWITLLSLVLPISVSGLALWQASQPTFPIRRLVRGALLMGLGINAMHYTGMTAMQMEPGIVYDPWLFAASVLIAIVASGAALWISFVLRRDAPHIWAARAAAAVVMGGAIVGMHYTGMAAANFPAGSICGAATAGFNQNALALTVIVATLGVLTVAMMASIFDARLDAGSRLLAESEAASVDREQLLAREREARAQAEQLNLMKDEFLAVISHELRTPLNAILGWTQIIRRGNLNPASLQKGMETIERNAYAQSKLIEDLLDMSKIISGKVTLESSMVDLEDLVDQALATAQPAATAQGVQLLKTVATPAPPVYADAQRMQQVLGNLLSNAIKFTPAGGRVGIRLDRAGDQVLIRVEDTGIGIAPHFLPYVFDRFRQADATTTRKYGGLGLGLSIVKNLVQLHGGTVAVDSAGEGQGTAFTITLPILAASRGPAAIRAAAEQRHVHVLPDLNGMKALVVEDVQDTRDFLEHLLRSVGATVVAAPNARQALDLLEREKPDVIVSDIGLPEVDGYEFMRRIRSLSVDNGGRTPALALTAFTRGEDRQRAFEAGFSDYMEKPFDQAAFLAKVGSLLK